MLIAYLAIGYVPSLSWDSLSQPLTSLNEVSDMPSLRKGGGDAFHSSSNEIRVWNGHGCSAGCGVIKEQCGCSQGEGGWIIPLNDIPSTLNGKQDSTSSPKQVSCLPIADCEKTSEFLGRASVSTVIDYLDPTAPMKTMECQKGRYVTHTSWDLV